MRIKRKIFDLPVNAELMNRFPTNIKKTLKVLEGRGVAIKGGFARYCLIDYLKLIGKFTDDSRYLIEKNVSDLDIILLKNGSWEQETAALIDKGKSLQAELGKFGLTIEAKDVEFVKGGHFDPKMIGKVLCSRDLTINEVVLVNENGQWVINYTPQCYCDLRDGVGYINPKPGHMRIHRGVYFPSPRGLARAIKFLAAGKINKIVFPEFQRRLFFEEFERRVKAENLPAGVRKQYEPLEFFGLVLFKIYCTDPKVQKGALEIMIDLGLTDGMLGVEQYIREQEMLSALHGSPFELEEQTWEKVIGKQIASNTKAAGGKKDRKDQRANCKHTEMTSYECAGCDWHCPIEACQKCTLAIFNPPLPCQNDLAAGKLPHSENIYYIPRFTRK